jgi:hypothetical protein
MLVFFALFPPQATLESTQDRTHPQRGQNMAHPEYPNAPVPRLLLEASPVLYVDSMTLLPPGLLPMPLHPLKWHPA